MGRCQNDLHLRRGRHDQRRAGAARCAPWPAVPPLDPLLTDALCDRIADGQSNTAIGKVPEFQSEYLAYLDKFGDRCLEELKLESADAARRPAIAAAFRGAAGPASEQRRSSRPPKAAKRKFAGGPRRSVRLRAAASAAAPPCLWLGPQACPCPRARPGESAFRAHAAFRTGALHLSWNWDASWRRSMCSMIRAMSSTWKSRKCLGFVDGTAIVHRSARPGRPAQGRVRALPTRWNRPRRSLRDAGHGPPGQHLPRHAAARSVPRERRQRAARSGLLSRRGAQGRLASSPIRATPRCHRATSWWPSAPTRAGSCSFRARRACWSSVAVCYRTRPSWPARWASRPSSPWTASPAGFSDGDWVELDGSTGVVVKHTLSPAREPSHGK